MPQARVLTDHEQKRILAVVAITKHAPRSLMAFVLSYHAGMRVGEIASITVGDVFEADCRTVRSQIRLSSDITKGGHARVVFVSDRLRREIEKYRATLGDSVKSERPLLTTQKRTAFSANTLCQLMGDLYNAAGLDGATSYFSPAREQISPVTKLKVAGQELRAHQMPAGCPAMGLALRWRRGGNGEPEGLPMSS